MGQWSILSVGRVVLAWKYQIPSFLTFLFEDADLTTNPPKDPEDEERGHSFIGYRSTASRAREHLDELGFSLDFCASVYEDLSVDLDFDERVADHVAEAIAERENYTLTPEAADAAALTHLKQFPATSAREDLDQFVDLLRRLLRDEGDDDFLERMKRSRPGSDEIDLDLDGLSLYITGAAALTLHPGVLRVAQLFEELLMQELPEPTFLLLARLLVEVVPPQSRVELDLSDMWDEGVEFDALPAHLAADLVRKMETYRRMFAVLSTNEADIRRRTAHARIRELLGSLSRARSNEEKGRLLEDLTSVLFGSSPEFVVAERDYSLGDQEIDLVVRNDARDGFWRMIGSPLFLVECKNWKRAVGAKEVRDFETKLRDHPLAKLGFFVAPGGFSRDVDAVLLRASREPYEIVPIRVVDIRRLLNEQLDVRDWLAGLISKLR